MKASCARESTAEQVDLGDDRELDRQKDARSRRPWSIASQCGDGAKGRVTDSVELALKLGDGTLQIDAVDGSEPVVMSERLVSWEFGITLPPLEPRLFSFNSPHGACPSCDGLGVRSAIDVGRIVPDESRSLREGAIACLRAARLGSHRHRSLARGRSAVAEPGPALVGVARGAASSLALRQRPERRQTQARNPQLRGHRPAPAAHARHWRLRRR